MIQCLHDQICYAREVTVYGQQRYRMGCIDKQHCSETPTTQAPTSPQVVGKRSLNQTCSLCCGNDHCNARTCDNQQHHSLGDSFNINLLDSNSTCVDSNSMACTAFGALDTNACNILPNVDIMCPHTCGICGHFGWSSWSVWSACSATCNDGISQRSRTCLHQIDVSHQHNCTGIATEQHTFEGHWADWESWGECSRTCSSGTTTRIRQCENTSQKQGGLYCPGERLEDVDCHGQPCRDDTSCPDDWVAYHDACYFFGHSGMSFANSQTFCEHRQAKLVNIQSAEENSFIINHLLTFKNPGDGWWIGMTWKNSHWQWNSGTTRNTYTNWYPGEGTSVGENCVVLYPGYNFTMADVFCNLDSQYALCEKHQ